MKIDFKSFTKKWNRPPKNQFPTGTIVYKNHQGSGKTLSMCHDALDIAERFPNCKIYSNVKLKFNRDYYFYESDKDLERALADANGVQGVLILIDEAHLYFSKKNGISLESLTAISQQRKDRRLILMTSQIWEELDISTRKQVKTIVKCTCLFNRIQINTFFDGHSLKYDNRLNDYTANKLYTSIFKHNQELYDSYDTYQKIIPNKDLDIRYKVYNTHPINNIKIKS